MNKEVFFDTETTGLHSAEGDEILSISMVDGEGNVLLDTLVRPTNRDEWSEAEAINHITPEMVKDAPTAEELSGKINEILSDTESLVAYNIDFDIGFLAPLLTEENEQRLNSGELKTHCAMREYATYHGEWDKKRNVPKWKKLAFAMEDFELEWRGQAHGSLADTFAARDVYQEVKRREEIGWDNYSMYGGDGFYYKITGGDITGEREAVITRYTGKEKDLSVPSQLGYNGAIMVVGIEESAFADNKNLQAVAIPDSVTEIGKDAFRNCTSLESASIPRNLKDWENAFPENTTVTYRKPESSAKSCEPVEEETEKDDDYEMEM